MNWALISTGFIFGTWKFMFVHWMVYAAFTVESKTDVLQIFASSTAGAWVTMGIFFFASSFFMKRASQKRVKAMEEARAKGETYNPYARTNTRMNRFKGWAYWRTNRLIVWIKRNIGIYGVTLIGPLILSIPIGSIVCAKFYGSQKKTFPLMLLGAAFYSGIMCTWIYFTL